MNSQVRKVIGWSATLTLIALVVGCSPSKPSPETPQSASGSSQESASKASGQSVPKSTHPIGEVVSIQDKQFNWEFTVDGIREHKGKGVLKPNQGNKWILVKTTTVNKGQDTQTLSLASFELIDSKNNSYEVALLAGALEDVESPTGQLKPGDVRQGEVAFEVPAAATGLKLLFKPNSGDCQAIASKQKTSATPNCKPIAVKLN
ncbi:MAG TPA: DUF4352 domain-containing protein [Coleofasciculaceae cyanobacterium]|jgi:hypothetical protein